MPTIRFSKEDLLGGKQLKPGWRRLKVKSVNEGPGKSDPSSTVYALQFVVEEGEELGVPVNHWFTEKQMFRLVAFLACFTGGKVEEGKDYRLDDVVGKSILGNVGFDINTGFNSISEFRPADKKATA
jgi:hypothetical protein